ncbi:MAG TPA: YkgJ family cysteine cluster protein [Candidatus Wallbacteria bacterium]|nr:YkgJ family cysteine cluster protein [Candidatus Wallbacteria bacterium]
MNSARIVLSSLKAQVKRRFVYYFSREQVKESLKKRKGECLGCGKCCQAVVPCPMLYKSGPKLLCKIHQHKPYVCHLYPVSGADFFPHLKHVCGYWFTDEKEKKS